MNNKHFSAHNRRHELRHQFVMAIFNVDINDGEKKVLLIFNLQKSISLTKPKHTCRKREKRRQHQKNGMVFLVDDDTISRAKNAQIQMINIQLMKTVFYLRGVIKFLAKRCE